jgi:DNA polymerase-3 subunit delta'
MQLFVGQKEGTLAMAIAYAQYILCGNQNEKTCSNEACNLKLKKKHHPDLHFAYPTVTTDAVKKSQKY